MAACGAGPAGSTKAADIRRESMASEAIGNGQAIAAYIAGARDRRLPVEVADMARLCLGDWLGVAIGAGEEPAGRIVREAAASWLSSGRATVLFGSTAAA